MCSQLLRKCFHWTQGLQLFKANSIRPEYRAQQYMAVEISIFDRALEGFEART